MPLLDSPRFAGLETARLYLIGSTCHHNGGTTPRDGPTRDSLQGLALEQLSQCDELYEAGYNLEEACFEISPRLREGLGSAVPVVNPLPRNPSRPAILAIQVLSNGTAGKVIVKDPSDVAEFSIQAVAFAKNLAYTPATKSGRVVTAWLELPFYARRP